MKICNTCLVEKPESDFGRDKECAQGIKHRCKACTSQYQKDHYKLAQIRHPPSVPAEGKRCSACLVFKPESAFYLDSKNHDGVKAKCKTCFTERKGTAMSSKQIRDEEFNRKMATDISFSENVKNSDLSKKQQTAFRNRARKKLRYAVKVGKLTRQPCESCGKTSGVQGHHDDYSKPLEVRWLCRKHHGLAHVKFQFLHSGRLI